MLNNSMMKGGDFINRILISIKKKLVSRKGQSTLEYALVTVDVRKDRCYTYPFCKFKLIYSESINIK